MHTTKINYHGLSPLLMQNPYSKFILAIKTLVFDQFSKFFQALLRQIEIQLQNRKHFPCPPAVENSRQNSLSEVSFCTLDPNLQAGSLTGHFEFYVYENIKARFSCDQALTGNISKNHKCNTFEPRHEKTNILVSDLVQHKPGCATTEYS